MFGVDSSPVLSAPADALSAEEWEGTLGRHRTAEEKAAFAVQAVEMRRQGIGVRRIAAALGTDQKLVRELLKDEPAPASLLRLRAKDEHREAAVALRTEGRTYKEIQAELGVSKGSLSLWLRDLPFPTDAQRTSLRAREAEDAEPTDDKGIARALRGDGWLLREIAEELGVSIGVACGWCAGMPVPPRATHGGDEEHVRAMVERRWAPYRKARDEARADVHRSAAAAVGTLSRRDRDLVAAALYWAEGAKSKPWRPMERVSFINSDVDMVRFFLSWLRAQGVDDSRLSLRVSIHESADLDRATSCWAEATGLPVDSFAKPLLKRHNPKTTRKNVNDDYIGCLVVTVRQSRLLYQRLEGLWRAAHAAD